MNEYSVHQIAKRVGSELKIYMQPQKSSNLPFTQFNTINAVQFQSDCSVYSTLCILDLWQHARSSDLFDDQNEAMVTTSRILSYQFLCSLFATLSLQRCQQHLGHEREHWIWWCRKVPSQEIKAMFHFVGWREANHPTMSGGRSTTISWST